MIGGNALSLYNSANNRLVGDHYIFPDSPKRGESARNYSIDINKAVVV
jgi:hypothetical protein